MPALLEWARKIVKAAPKIVPVELGPWEGSMRSVTADLVPQGYAAQSVGTESDFLYNPRRKSFKRRGGQTQLFDTFGSGVGLLPSKPLSLKARWMEEFPSDSFTDSLPSVATLVTKETIGSGLDDGLFSYLWLRDQVNNFNYTLGDEYGTATYPAPGSIQQYKLTPLWYDSGDGGLTRGTTEFARRFFLCGARRFGRVGNWWYFPSLFGTPSRWRGRFIAGGTTSASNGTSMIAAGAWTDQSGGVINLHTFIDEFPADDTDWIQVDVNAGGQISVNIGLSTPSPLPASTVPHTIQFRYRRTGGTGTTPGLVYTFYKGNSAVTIKSATLAALPITTTWTDYSYALSGAEIASLANAGTGGGAYNLMNFLFNWTGAAGTAGSLIEVSMLRVSFGAVITSTTILSDANRLIPSGPLPPVHAGTLTGGAAVTASNARPDATTASGSWLNNGGGAATFDRIDEVTADDADYISSNGSNTRFQASLGDPGVSVNVGDAVTIRLRIFETVASGHNNLTVSLLDPTGATVYASQLWAFNSSFGWTAYSLALTAAQVTTLSAASVTNLQLWFETGSESGLDRTYISQAYLEILPAAASSEGGWKGHDRFYYSVAYRFEDGSVWMPCTPRAPNSLLTNGYNLFTVDSANPDLSYGKITWSNLPIGPYGTVGRLLLRTPKIDKTVDDNLQLNPYDLRVVWEIQDNTTTTYDDFFGDDLSLTLDVEKAFVRFDHSMPPRARYFAGGDMRVAHCHGGLNPSAIVLSPIGAAADYDRNLVDTVAAAYAQSSFYFRLLLDNTGTDILRLTKSDGTTPTNKDFTLTAGGSYDTLQKLVDGINATSFAVDAMQWRAQLAPGASPDALSATALTPNARTLGSCVMTSGAATISLAAGGLSKVAVGTLVSHANFATGTYVSGITSDILLTVSANSSATSTATVTFYSELGDSPTTGTANLGYQRAICNALPSFLYFNKTYLNNYPLQKNATWMTVASPGAIKSAANCFSNKESNRFQPPVDPGIGTGVVAVDQGFVVYYAKKRAAIRPREGSSGGRDEDYRLIIINESSGVPAWNTVVAGNRCAVGLSPEGVVVSDLFRERICSYRIWAHATSDQATGTGDFSADLYLAVYGAAKDSDDSYFSARIMRGVLWLNYPSVTGSAPSRQVTYDFSAADDLNGVQAFFRKDGEPWGWSLPLVRTFTTMCEVRRSTGTILYGWNDSTVGTTGYGRLDSFEDGSSTDNGTAIAGSVSTAYVRAGDRDKLSAQEITYEHSSPAGSTGSMTFHRSFTTGGDTDYTLTPGTSSLVVASELKMLPTGARSAADACFITYSQATGSARELRWLQLTLKRMPTYR